MFAAAAGVVPRNVVTTGSTPVMPHRLLGADGLATALLPAELGAGLAFTFTWVETALRLSARL